MKKIFKIANFVFGLLANYQIVLAQTSSPSATQSATSGGLPNAGNVYLTVVITTIALLIVIAGAISFFKSFR